MEVLEPFLNRIDNPEHRVRMEDVFAWILSKFPTLEPKIAWNQPMFTDHGTFIIGFSVAKQHMAVAPEEAAMARFAEEIERSGYGRTKGLFRIRWNEPVDFSLLEKLIEFNIEDKADCTTFWRK